MKKINIGNATIGLIILTFISKVLGFVREMVISYIYGASAMSDAYSMANSVAVLLVTGLASGIMTAYIPSSMEIENNKERNCFTSRVLNSLMVGSVIIAVISLIFTEQIVSVIGMGFTNSTKQYTIVLLRFVILSSICIFLIYFISGYLNTKGNFSYSGIQLIVTNLIIIIAVVMNPNNPYELGLGYLIAYIVPMVLGICYLRRYQFSYRWDISFSDVRLKKLYAVSLIAFFGTNVVKLNVMADRIFASNLQEGTVAAINYAFTLTSIFPEVFVLSMATVIYPKLSELFHENRLSEFGNSMTDMINETCMLLVPITILFITMGKWIVEILFQRGAFNAQDTLLTVEVLKGYALGGVGIGLCLILCKAFFARKEELIPAVCLGIGIVFNFAMNALYAGRGAWELSITTSISITLPAILMLIILIKKVPAIEVKRLGSTSVKIILAGGAMYILVRELIQVFMKFNIVSVIEKILALGAIAVVAMIFYLVILYVTGVKEVKTGVLIVKEKMQSIWQKR